MDTIKTLARERFFFTAEIELADYGQVVVIGDQDAVERLLAVIEEHAGHELVSLELKDRLARQASRRAPAATGALTSST